MIKFNTVFNSDVTKAMNNHQMKKIRILYFIFTAIFLVIGLLNIRWGDYFFGGFLIIFSIGFFPLCKLLTKVLQKNLDKSLNLLSDQTREEFRFFEDRIEMETVKGDDYSSSAVAKYNYLYEVAEEKDCYILYISKAQAHVIFKDYLTEGSLEELNEILTRNLGKKFKKIKE